METTRKAVREEAVLEGLDSYVYVIRKRPELPTVATHWEKDRTRVVWNLNVLEMDSGMNNAQPEEDEAGPLARPIVVHGFQRIERARIAARQLTRKNTSITTIHAPGEPISEVYKEGYRLHPDDVGRDMGQWIEENYTLPYNINSFNNVAAAHSREHALSLYSQFIRRAKQAERNDVITSHIAGNPIPDGGMYTIKVTKR